MSPAAEAPPSRRAATHLPLFIWFVLVLGTALMVAQISQAAPDLSHGRWVNIVVFGVLLTVCEIRPIALMAKSGEVDEIVASTTFAFALLLSFGPAVAMLCQAGASLIADRSSDKEIHRAAFNVAQYWVAWGLAGFAMQLVSGGPHISPLDPISNRGLAAELAAAVVFFVVNNCLIGAVVAINGGAPVIRNIRSTMRREASSDWVLLALAPVVRLVSEHNIRLLPLLLLPVLAVYRSATVSLEKEHQAKHDSLTDLPNRRLFRKELDDAIRRAKRGGKQLAVLLIDLNHFKEINDTLGHHAGDELLKKIGPRILDAVPDGSMVARLGGDEFAVLVRDLTRSARGAEVGEAIVRSLDAAFEVDGFALDVEASIGIACFPEHGGDPDVLLQHADIAMYVAKAHGTGVEVYDPENDRHSRRRLTLLSDLRRAIAEKQLELYYQPKLDLRTGKVHSVEALVRWDHPEFGRISPDDFVPMAEHTGLIRPLTEFVLEEAVAQARLWADLGHDLPVAVNLSARCLHDADLPVRISTLLDRHGVSPRHLELEITESAIMADATRARRILDVLHKMGLWLAIDDFGTGYSSLAYLQRLPVSEIKVDKSFVTTMTTSQSDRMIVQSTIALASNLGLKVTAEGVETEGVRDQLVAAGCDFLQGYLLSRPLTARDLETWLEAHDRALPAPASTNNVVPLPARHRGA